MVGALRDGRKVVLAIESGQRESKGSWAPVVRDLRARVLKPWKVTVADPHLGRQSLCKSSRSVPRLSPGYPKLLSVGGVESAALAPGA